MKWYFIGLIVCLAMSVYIPLQAQEENELIELQAQKAEKEAEAAALQAQLNAIKGEISNLESRINKTIKWHYGSGGILGADFTNFNNWAPKADLNSSAANISFVYNGYANLIQDKYFWRNAGAINLGWLRYDENTQIRETDENNSFRQVADVFNVQSLLGYNVLKNLATSALAEYRTSVLSNFNNPGYLDFGIGLTLTPAPDLVITAHPLNYNLVISRADNVYNSSLGAKIVASYSTAILKGVTWRSNLSSFISYGGSSLSNHTWINGLNIKAVKNVGVGIEYGWRWNPQETAARELPDNNQSYYAIGLSYTL